MRKHYSSLVFALVFVLGYGSASAQLITGNMFLQGRWLEIGAMANGALGSSIAAPGTYHPHNGGSTVFLCSTSSPNLLAEVYDYGHDGWTVGTPPYMGDYTLPGSPWEGWAVEVAGTPCYAYTSSCGFTGTLTGSWVGYTNTGGQALGYWQGSTAAGALAIRKQYRVDTLGSALIVTAIFTNTTAAPLTGVYYMRSCDPDNDESWIGGSGFTTNNIINYQNDAIHRVQVSARAYGADSTWLSLSTKDCRAKAFIYTSWPMSTACDLAAVWAASATCLGTSYYVPQVNHTGDIAIGLVYNIGTIAANDSAAISYAYVFNGQQLGVDSAFPAPQLVTNGSAHYKYDTIVACTGGIGDTVLANIINGSDRAWTWSDWSWAPATGLLSTTGVSSGVVISALSGVTTFTITGSNPRMGTCVVDTMYLTVVPAISAPPTVVDVTYCQGAVAVPLTATGIDLLWYTTATGGVGSTTAPTPSTMMPGTTTYWVSEDPCGFESARTALNVTVLAPPVVVPTNNGPVCSYSTIDLFAHDAGGSTTATYAWTGPGGFASFVQNPTSTSGLGPDTLVYTVVMTVNGCLSAPANDTVIVKFKPSLPIVADTSYCQYSSSVALTAIGSNLSWYTAPTGGSPLGSAPVPPTTTVGSTTWYVSQTINGCEGDRAPISVTILFLPDFTISAVRPYDCQYDTITLSYNGPSMTGPSYTWALPGGASFVGGTTSSDPSVLVKFDSLYFQSVILTASDYFGRCTTSDTIHMHIVPQPVASDYVAPNICVGDTTTLALVSHTGNSDHYFWDFAGGNIITGSSNSGGPYSLSWLDTGLHVITMVAYTVEGCRGDTVLDTINVHPLPDAHITSSGVSGVVCIDDSVQLVAESNNLSYTYHWKPDHFFSNDNSWHVWGKIETVGYVTLTVTDAFGCTASDSILFTPDACCTVSFPSAFTPNGDGKNDKFRPIFQGFHKFHNFRVVNRWGETVFESTNNNMEWDGTFNGVPQDIGIYYYFVKFDCDNGTSTGPKIVKGEVTLVR